MRLTGQEILKFRDDLVKVYFSFSELEQLLLKIKDKNLETAGKLPLNLEALTGRGPLNDVAYDLIGKAIAQGWIEELLEITKDDIENYDEHQQLQKRINPSQTPYNKELSNKLPRRSLEQIIGREAVLKDLYHRLFNEKKALLLNGMGGIGKTTMAEVYLTTYYEEYQHILWVTQLPQESVMHSFLQTNGLLENLKIELAENKPEQLFSLIISRLKSINTQPNLLIIDNADNNLEAIYSLLPNQPQWHLLVTSREILGEENFNIKVLDFLSEAEAIKLFKQYYKLGKIEAAEIIDLVHALDYHTLAIEIFAKTAQTKRKTARELYQIIRDDLYVPSVKVRHGSQDFSSNKVDRIRAYLSSVFKVVELDEDEQWLLFQFFCLPPEFHSYELLEDLIQPSLHQKEDRFSDLLYSLSQKGWLLYNEGLDSYKLHRIIAEVIDTSLLKEISEVKPLIDSIASKLLTKVSDSEFFDFSWIAFGERVLTIFEGNTSIGIIELQSNLGLALENSGYYQAAKNLYEKIVSACEIHFEDSSLNLINGYYNLANQLSYLGDFERAKSLLEKVRLLLKKSAQENIPLYFMASSKLAIVLLKLGESIAAKELLENIIGTYHRRDHKISIMYSDLASILTSMGSFAEAKTYLEKAIIIEEELFGKDSIKTVEKYLNLGVVLYYLDDLRGANELFEQVVILNEKYYGKEHPNTAQAYSNLAATLVELGDYIRAKSLLEASIQINEKFLPTVHSRNADDYYNLGVTLLYLEDYEATRTYLAQSLAIQEQISGKDHDSCAEVYTKLGIVYQKLGDDKLARPYFELAYTILIASLGENHPKVKQIKEVLDNWAY